MTAYAEWTLGTSRGAAAPSIVTTRDPGTGALLARNPWNTEFGGRVAFLDMGSQETEWTADRSEFLGRNGGADAPISLDLDSRCQAASGPGSIRVPRSGPDSSWHPGHAPNRGPAGAGGERRVPRS